MIKLDKYIGDDWIAASKSRNYALDDPCLDYFRAFNIKDITDKPKKMKYIFEPSSKYERENKTINDAMIFVQNMVLFVQNMK